MPDPTVTPTPPAHPWIRTGRSILGGLITAAILVPLAVQAAGIDVTAEGYGWIAGVLGVLAAVTRIMAVPAVNAWLAKVGLGAGDVDAGKVLAMVLPAPHPAAGPRIVAGEAAPQPTGTPLPQSTTVAQLDPGPE